jgi:hypothetical protein
MTEVEVVGAVLDGNAYCYGHIPDDPDVEVVTASTVDYEACVVCGEQLIVRAHENGWL